MEIVVERVAGLDVHKASVTACVRAPVDGGERAEHVETFTTTVPSLLALADWLEAHGVTQVAMEATGVYWKPVWAVLEDRFECILVKWQSHGRAHDSGTAGGLGASRVEVGPFTPLAERGST
jgi:hypothetical protein